MDTNQTLRSGDLELIVTGLSKEEILEHFGEESFEHLAYEHMLADRLAEEIQSKNISSRSIMKILPLPAMVCGSG